MTLGETIRYYREKVGLSQEGLAEKVGVSRQSVSKWELNEATPEVGKLVTLAKTFGITTDELLSGERSEGRPAEQMGEDRTSEAQRSGDPLGNKGSLIERMIRKYGWIAGIYLALEGLGVALVGGVARFVFGRMFQVAAYNYATTIEVNGQLVQIDPYAGRLPTMGEAFGELLGGAAMASGLGKVLVGVATLILVVGLLWMTAGIVLAIVLRRKRKDS